MPKGYCLGRSNMSETPPPPRYSNKTSLCCRERRAGVTGAFKCACRMREALAWTEAPYTMLAMLRLRTVKWRPEGANGTTTKQCMRASGVRSGCTLLRHRGFQADADADTSMPMPINMASKSSSCMRASWRGCFPET